jgi:hypothetical protein
MAVPTRTVEAKGCLNSVYLYCACDAAKCLFVVEEKERERTQCINCVMLSLWGEW